MLSPSLVLVDRLLFLLFDALFLAITLFYEILQDPAAQQIADCTLSLGARSPPPGRFFGSVSDRVRRPTVLSIPRSVARPAL